MGSPPKRQSTVPPKSKVHLEWRLRDRVWVANYGLAVAAIGEGYWSEGAQSYSGKPLLPVWKNSVRQVDYWWIHLNTLGCHSSSSHDTLEEAKEYCEERLNEELLRKINALFLEQQIHQDTWDAIDKIKSEWHGKDKNRTKRLLQRRIKTAMKYG